VKTGSYSTVFEPLREPQKVIGLRGKIATTRLYLVGIPGTLPFVIDPNMLSGEARGGTAVLLEEAIDVLDEHAAGESILQHPDKRTITGKENCGTLIGGPA
jgi:hypothetical protein